MNQLWKEGEKKSLLGQLGIKNTPLKYGNGWFSYIDGQYSQIRKLQMFSTSIELPRTEVTQPVNSMIMRIGFKLAKRNNK
jgi:hypothetical protein